MIGLLDDPQSSVESKIVPCIVGTTFGVETFFACAMHQTQQLQNDLPYSLVEHDTWQHAAAIAGTTSTP